MSLLATRLVVLKDGVPFSNWKGDLAAALSSADVLGHVFHDINGIDPEIEPSPPKAVKEEVPSKDHTARYEAAKQEYKAKLRAWIKGEFQAVNIIVQRLDSTKTPLNYHKYTAKQLFDMIASSNEVADLLPHSQAFDTFLATKFTTTAEDYCTRFLHNLQNVNNAADSLTCRNSSADNYKITDELASVFFVRGTNHVKWLDIWRETKAVSVSQYAPLRSMITSLRAAAGIKKFAANDHMLSAEELSAHEYTAAVAHHVRNDPNDWCRICKHKHRNKDCYKQHPEKAQSRQSTNEAGGAEDEKSTTSNSKGKGCTMVMTESSPFDSENEGEIFITA